MSTDDQASSGAQDPHRIFEHDVRFLSREMVNGRLISAARALLGWDQVQLAERAGIRRQTLADMEGEVRRPQARIRDAVLAALEGEGVRFIAVDKAFGLVLGPNSRA